MHKNWLLALLLACFSQIVNAAPVYFVVSETTFGWNSHGDSYILPLEDPLAIAHARDLIAYGPGIGESIVVARVEPGSDGINRDFLGFEQPLWSWYVAEFLGFSDFTAEIFDGWPGYVEEDLFGWMMNTGGTIGFSSYTVTRELTLAEALGHPVPTPGTAYMLIGGLLLMSVRPMLHRKPRLSTHAG